MSVAAISSTPAYTPASSPTATAVPARSGDGDYKAANVRSAQTRDSDGDYKPLTSSAAGQSSPSLQASLTSLKIGG
jgi:hypothetical protein